MNEDRELLELAAKAAEINGGWIGGNGSGLFALPGLLVWNPLTDDGDALRLAVKLRIAVNVEDEDCNAATATFALLGRYSPNSCVECFSDYEDGQECAAVRRAIVRAAAEIAKAKAGAQ